MLQLDNVTPANTDLAATAQRYSVLLLGYNRTWLVVMLTPGMATCLSLSENYYSSRAAFPNHSQRSGGCDAYQQSPACTKKIRLQTSRRVAYALGSQARRRPFIVSAAVAEQNIAHEASEDTSQVQTFLQWLAIQGCAS